MVVWEKGQGRLGGREGNSISSPRGGGEIGMVCLP